VAPEEGRERTAAPPLAAAPGLSIDVKNQ